MVGQDSLIKSICIAWWKIFSINLITHTHRSIKSDKRNLLITSQIIRRWIVDHTLLIEIYVTCVGVSHTKTILTKNSAATSNIDPQRNFLSHYSNSKKVKIPAVYPFSTQPDTFCLSHIFNINPKRKERTTSNCMCKQTMENEEFIKCNPCQGITRQVSMNIGDGFCLRRTVRQV